ncbi:alpha/beta hydrolase [Pelotalea chapellei]|uniref:Alpha/beta hydrolase n=1 Tax=Pelotalea chapellei TaxID=44671 RepID=A0ABS5UD06_9BACT|nr:alpha/beta hydrolase [Pelotalea chapellei]MBT1073552.1 alpha/beta hydrolase [Pelotalea chapellei]
MKYVQMIIFACLLLLPFAGRAEVAQYGYPIQGSYEATILGTPDTFKPDLPVSIRTRELTLDIFPDRKKPEIFFYDKGLRCTMAYQTHKAPLAFLIAGTGAGNQAPHQMTMMKSLYQAGFHVITLSSPTSPNFIVSASQSRVPGDMEDDAKDLYRAMETAWNSVKNDIEVSDFYLSGYSLGGTQAAFVALLDEELKIFNFRKVLMINPAISVYSSAERIEELLRAIPGGSTKVGYFFNDMLARFSEFYSYNSFVAINDEFIYTVYKEKLFSHEEAGGLVGLAFRINSAGMIFTSDVMTNSGYVVPKNRKLKTTDSLFEYFTVSTHLSLFNYLNEYLYPNVHKKKPGLTKAEFVASMSLKSIESYLKSSPKFGVMTNADDFLLTQDERNYLRELFGERVKIFPRGGHLGNLEYKENLAHMVEFFKKP